MTRLGLAAYLASTLFLAVAITALILTVMDPNMRALVLEILAAAREVLG